MELDWKFLAVNIVCMMFGLLAGLQMNVDAQAHGQAIGMCNTTMANLNTMVENFNVLSLEYMPRSECTGIKVKPYNITGVG